MCAGRYNNQGTTEEEITQRLYPEIKSSEDQENFMDGFNTESQEHLPVKESISVDFLSTGHHIRWPFLVPCATLLLSWNILCKQTKNIYIYITLFTNILHILF